MVRDCPELLAAVLAGTPGRTAYVLVRNVSLAACWPAGGVAAPGSLTLLGLPDHTVVLDLAGLGAAFRLVGGGPEPGAPSAGGTCGARAAVPHGEVYGFRCRGAALPPSYSNRCFFSACRRPSFPPPSIPSPASPRWPQPVGSTVSLRYLTLTGLSRQQLAVPAADADAYAGGALVAAPAPQSVLSRATAALWGFCFDRWGPCSRTESVCLRGSCVRDCVRDSPLTPASRSPGLCAGLRLRPCVACFCSPKPQARRSDPPGSRDAVGAARRGGGVRQCRAELLGSARLHGGDHVIPQGAQRVRTAFRTS